MHTHTQRLSVNAEQQQPGINRTDTSELDPDTQVRTRDYVQGYKQATSQFYMATS